MKPGGRQFGRCVVNGLILVPLLLAVAVVGLWVRSYWFVQRVVTNHRGAYYLVTASAGSLCITRESPGEGIWALTSENRKVANVLEFENQPVVHTARDQFAGSFWRGFADWEVYGFGFYDGVHQEIEINAITMPLWFLVLVTLVPSLWWVVFCRRSRHPFGMCLKCGYDLRASKDSCPECGQPIPAVTAEIKRQSP